MELSKKYISVLSFTFLVFITLSCSKKEESIKGTQNIHFTHESRPIESAVNIIEARRLKFTTGIRSILEDCRGNIWFGSHQEGAGKFDGEKFTYYHVEDGLSDNQVRNIYEDWNGVIWFEGGKGISSYAGYNFSNFGQKIARQEEKNYNSTNDWKIINKSLWFKGEEVVGYNEYEGHPGVYQYDGQKFSFKKLPVNPQKGGSDYYSVTTPYIRGKDGTIWFGTYGAAIGYGRKGFTVIDNEYLNLNEETGFLHIRSLFEDNKGNIWIGNNGIGVLLYDGENVVNFTNQQKLQKKNTKGNSLDRVFSIGEDSLGNIWFGTVNSGVWRYNGKTLKNYTEKDGLVSKHIWTIYKSKSGEMWFGGANPSGVYKINGNNFERIY